MLGWAGERPPEPGGVKMESVVTLKRPALVLVLDYEGLDFATVLESVEDHLDLRQGQRQRTEQMLDLCIWRTLEGEREAVLDGSRLQLTGPAWFGAHAPAFCTSFRTMSEMLPLSVAASGVNPVFEVHVASAEDLEEIVHVGARLTAAFDEELELHELVWNAPMPSGGDARFRMRLEAKPWRAVLDCNWHLEHDGNLSASMDRWLSYPSHADELATRLTRAFARL
jgi:hypothetical protein